MADHEAPEPGLGTLLRQLVADGRAWAEAEAGYWQALAKARGSDALRGGILALAAIALAQGALVALLVGLVLALTPAVGALWATLIVIGAALLVAGLAGWFAFRWFRHALRPDRDGGDR